MAARTKRLLLPVIAALLLLLACLRPHAEAFRDRVPDCSAIISKSTFDTYKDVCAAIDGPQLSHFGPNNKWDIIETCTCNLLSHELAWAVMLTHPAECMYMSLIKLIDQIDASPDTKVGVPKNSSIFKSSPEGERMYYWDRLDDILNNQFTTEMQYEELSADFNLILADIYYDPSKFAIEFRGAKVETSNSMRRFISGTCKELLSNMEITLGYLAKLRQLSDNERYLFRVTNYNEDLHKIRMVLTYCKAIGAHGILI